MTQPSDPVDRPAECNDEPKLTAEEWEYVAAMAPPEEVEMNESSRHEGGD